MGGAAGHRHEPPSGQERPLSSSCGGRFKLTREPVGPLGLLGRGSGRPRGYGSPSRADRGARQLFRLGGELEFDFQERVKHGMESPREVRGSARLGGSDTRRHQACANARQGPVRQVHRPGEAESSRAAFVPGGPPGRRPAEASCRSGGRGAWRRED